MTAHLQTIDHVNIMLPVEIPAKISMYRRHAFTAWPEHVFIARDMSMRLCNWNLCSHIAHSVPLTNNTAENSSYMLSLRPCMVAVNGRQRGQAILNIDGGAVASALVT
jgi:hypothetical protein